MYSEMFASLSFICKNTFKTIPLYKIIYTNKDKKRYDNINFYSFRLVKGCKKKNKRKTNDCKNTFFIKSINNKPYYWINKQQL